MSPTSILFPVESGLTKSTLSVTRVTDCVFAFICSVLRMCRCAALVLAPSFCLVSKPGILPCGQLRRSSSYRLAVLHCCAGPSTVVSLTLAWPSHIFDLAVRCRMSIHVLGRCQHPGPFGSGFSRFFLHLPRIIDCLLVCLPAVDVFRVPVFFFNHRPADRAISLACSLAWDWARPPLLGV